MHFVLIIYFTCDWEHIFLMNIFQDLNSIYINLLSVQTSGGKYQCKDNCNDAYPAHIMGKYFKIIYFVKVRYFINCLIKIY